MSRGSIPAPPVPETRLARPAAPTVDPDAVGRLAGQGLLANALLAAVKFVAGLVGHSYALVADAVESGADVLGSLIVIGGLRVARREADDRYPFGYGRAESVAAAAVGLLLAGAAVGIAVEAVRAIRTPHEPPEPWTLGVLLAVIVIKEWLAARQRRVARVLGSPAGDADAWHHRSDALTSAAAAVGIGIAVLAGPAWAAADDWAALAAAGVIAVNGAGMLRRSVADLMDRAPDDALLAHIARAAQNVPGVCATEKLMVRRAGTGYHVDLHVQADPRMPLVDAHRLGGRVKGAIRSAVPAVLGVLVHMEPFEPDVPRVGTP